MNDAELIDAGAAGIFAQGKWAGVVAIERPEWPAPMAPCKVFSARAIEFNGRRAVVHSMPYSAVSQLFNSDDDSVIYVEATLADEHLQLHGRADFKDWAYYSARLN